MDTERFQKWYNKLVKWIVFISSILAIGCLFMRRHYKNEWINNYVSTEFKEKKNYGPLFREYHLIILGEDSDMPANLSKHKNVV
jgi:hypothetical protein